MSNDITIPPEAVRALRAALTACDCDKCLCDMIRAALNAWPGVESETGTSAYNPLVKRHRLILPLPKEKSE